MSIPIAFAPNDSGPAVGRFVQLSAHSEDEPLEFGTLVVETARRTRPTLGVLAGVGRDRGQVQTAPDFAIVGIAGEVERGDYLAVDPDAGGAVRVARPGDEVVAISLGTSTRLSVRALLVPIFYLPHAPPEPAPKKRAKR